MTTRDLNLLSSSDLRALLIAQAAQLETLKEELHSALTNGEMATAQLRGWQDFFSGQPFDMPYKDAGIAAKNSQLNFAWTVGYSAAEESTLWREMVRRADASANRSDAAHTQLVAQASHLEQSQKERDEAFDAIRSVLNDEPKANGEYVHLLICSGSRAKAVGESGCACPIGRWRKSAKALRDTVNDVGERMAERLLDRGK